ncbi:arginyl-tRNA synthetase [Alkaliphilus metalliredigens QYMF]|uniref:Arginine--tRNA ligase n=1 Tax=Alkaliphilus metalliredigens (strain QYMF) TaxID=293826 RepID=SYR_ALKMQ|nr:arginine--tRNA ligase [Alkaliphilus metalliredigens]A6TNX2.1 RecName: Full=Arginine--tRNA ligase; AltName: Full=Arginyl-tRNA synthetase; Short=ArgRS [Alkaliphilus metalliredigens QYMF]ABR47890.1 arginyl-tRNA synthetase [Alkaliphilus metalliredigens QYMF]
MSDFKQKVSELLGTQIEGIGQRELLEMIEVPPNSEMGDFAFPCFRLAKTFRKAPQVIAEELVAKIQLTDDFEKVDNTGGYLNFFVNRNTYAKAVIQEVLSKGDQYGSRNLGEGKNICIDYSAPNVAKPFHVGHLRSTVIGNSLYRIYDFLGYNCIGINHLGDWGTQFGKVIVAYKNWGDKAEIEKEPINTLLALYVKFHDEAEKNPDLEDEARGWFTKMEKGDEEALSLWKWFSSETIKELKKIYALLDVHFDHYSGESFYNDKMDVVIDELNKQNLLKESQGANIVDLEEYNMPPCLVQKKDGSTLYATRDIAAAIYRKNTFNFEKCLYVTDYSQNLHFAQWFKVIELMGYDWAKDIEHISFGRVTHEGRRIQSRKGSVVLLEEVLNGAVERISEIIEEKNPNVENKEQVAKDVGIGAIVFNDLSNNRIKDISFSWDTAFSFEGETGPYVQYTHARASSVLRKAEVAITDHINAAHLTDDVTMNVIKTIEQFPQVIVDAQRKNEPSIITRHIVNIAQAFNRFYHDHPILVEDEELKMARLAVVQAVKQVLSVGLSLIGIKAPEKM